MCFQRLALEVEAGESSTVSCYLEKSKQHQRYTGKIVHLAGKVEGIGVLCSQCTPSTSTLPTSSSPGLSTLTKLTQATTNLNRYTFANYQGSHSDCPVASYAHLHPTTCLFCIAGRQRESEKYPWKDQTSVSLAMAQH